MKKYEVIESALKNFKYILLIAFLSFAFFCPLYLYPYNDLEKKLDSFNSNAEKFNFLLDTAKKLLNTDLNNCVYLGEKCIEYVSDEIPTRSIGELYLILGYAYHDLGVYNKSIYYFIEAINLYSKEQSKYETELMGSYISLGETYRANVEFDKSLDFLEKAQAIAKDINNERGISHILDRKAAVYFEIAINKFDTSKIYIALINSEEALNLAKKNDIKPLIISSYNISGSCYSFLGQKEKAIESYEMALKESEYDSAYSDRPNILNNIANHYYLNNNIDLAEKYALQSYELSKKSGVKVYIREATSVLHKIYALKNDYKKAYKYLEEYNGLVISIFGEEKSKNILAIEKKYQEEQTRIALAEQKKQYSIISVSIFLLALIVIIMFFVRSRYLKKVNKKLQEMNKIISSQKDGLSKLISVKNKFFRILSHDLRNPFNGILGFTRILKNDYDKMPDEERKECIEYINVSSEYVFRLIENLIEWSRLQEGGYDFKKEQLNLNEFASGLVNLQKSNSLKKKIEIIVNINKEINVKCDRYFLDTILRNLVDNAIKFTAPGGKITIAASKKDGFAEISVKDTGVGISRDDLKNIFSIDNKLILSGTGEEKGTGLGLVLCRDMVEKMGGEIKADSITGKGTKFTFTLPLANEKS